MNATPEGGFSRWGQLLPEATTNMAMNDLFPIIDAAPAPAATSAASASS
jgi:hypothetical protein